MSRRSMYYRPINSLKHIVDITTVVLGTTKNILDLVSTVDAPTAGNTNQVPVGAVVKAIYLRAEGITTTTVTSGRPSLYIYVVKNPGNELVVPNPDEVGQKDVRKFVIHQEMIMMSANSADNFPRTIFKGVIRIPKKYQRFGQNDRLQLIAGWSQGVDAAVAADFCLQCIYKDFR